ncbi:MAG: BirA family biotin operon repressor/biotin-[acetyl-CoA-carboxylase] ligase [Rhodothermales bacterium]
MSAAIPGVDRIDLHAEAGSTNDLALALPDKGAVPVHLIVAERQTAGRGRQGNRWLAGEGALTFSALLHMSSLEMPEARRPFVSLATGLALCRALQSTVEAPCSVKWPNDVFIGDQKVAGILVESCPDAADCLVVGVGVNVRNSPAFELSDSATSIIDHGDAPQPQELLHEIMREFFASLAVLRSSQAVLVSKLNAVSYLTGRHIRVQDCCGICQGIAPSGAIAIGTSSGTRELIAGTVELL